MNPTNNTLPFSNFETNWKLTSFGQNLMMHSIQNWTSIAVNSIQELKLILANDTLIEGIVKSEKWDNFPKNSIKVESVSEFEFQLICQNVIHIIQNNKGLINNIITDSDLLKNVYRLELINDENNWIVSLVVFHDKKYLIFPQIEVLESQDENYIPCMSDKFSKHKIILNAEEILEYQKLLKTNFIEDKDRFYILIQMIQNWLMKDQLNLIFDEI
ncbi:MAG: hypothetical protein ACD_4C00031G0002 [uncultured bacterium (gcode 4)]|uniref:Uncharacterized protein n=1 Tax=uncultured bacterium (gcode 4) TaxID=1234023 RepID=K2GAI5_9BACT|nr:MAG: hypothetical protein ACD_4C00031G0002 [uncultured bacterium (gcode 4)]